MKKIQYTYFLGSLRTKVRSFFGQTSAILSQTFRLFPGSTTDHSRSMFPDWNIFSSLFLTVFLSWSHGIDFIFISRSLWRWDQRARWGNLEKSWMMKLSKGIHWTHKQAYWEIKEDFLELKEIIWDSNYSMIKSKYYTLLCTRPCTTLSTTRAHPEHRIKISNF